MLSLQDKTENLKLKSRLISALRLFFENEGYLEVDTPIRLPEIAPEPYIEPVLSQDHFLQTSPELCMKRLLAAGYEKIFQICHCFRQMERGARHLPEFLLLEWYTAGTDYIFLMDQTERLIRFVARSIGKNDRIEYRGRQIELADPFPRIPVVRAFELFSPISLEEAVESGRFEEIISEKIEPSLDFERPVFLYDYPMAFGALARAKDEDPRIAERFELYMGGLEICNGFSELNDPFEQKRRFLEDIRERNRLNRPAVLPERFLKALRHMPPASGNALGVERLAMIFADTSDIDDVCTFTPEEL